MSPKNTKHMTLIGLIWNMETTENKQAEADEATQDNNHGHEIKENS